MSGRREAPLEPTHNASRHLSWLAPAALVLIGFAVYSGTFNGPFLYDDYNAIVENPHVRSLWPLGRALSAPDESTVAGRPVVALSLAVNYAISGLEPWSYHLVNILLHVLCALLVYGIVRRTLALPRLRSHGDMPGAPWAFAVALVWLVHPLHTEVVTYVSTRTESLAALFLLLALYAAIRGAKDSVHSGLWSGAAILSSLLGMASKEIAAAIPILVFLYDGVFLADGFKDALARRRGLYAGLAASWLVLAALVAEGPRSGTVSLTFAELTPLDYARTQVAVIWHYLRLAVWPHPLALDYHDWPVARAFTAPVLLGGLALLALVAGTLWLVVRRSWLGFVGAWFFVILAPSSSVVPIASEIAAERRMYLPLLSLVVLALGGAWLLASRLAGDGGRRTVLPVVVAAVAAALGAATVARNADYRDEVTIWAETVRVRPNNVRALQNLGSTLAHHGRSDEAVPYLERALQLDPMAEYAVENLGLIRLDEGRYAEAISLLKKRIERRPKDAISRVNLAKALLATGDRAAALAQLEEAVRLTPDNAVARARLALVLADLGRLDEAAGSADRAVELDPDNETAQLAAGRVALLANAPEQAARHYREALEHSRASTEAALGLAVALRRTGQPEQADAAADALAAALTSPDATLQAAMTVSASVASEAAVELLQAAIRRAPDAAELHLALGRFLASINRSSEALAAYRRALELRPRWADAANSLALLWATADDAEVRDPAAAVSLADELSAAAGHRHPVLLSTLGIALASAGRRAEAEQRLGEAGELARRADQTVLADEIERQLELVRSGWPPPPSRRAGSPPEDPRPDIG